MTDKELGKHLQNDIDKKFKELSGIIELTTVRKVLSPPAYLLALTEAGNIASSLTHLIKIRTSRRSRT